METEPLFNRVPFVGSLPRGETRSIDQGVYMKSSSTADWNDDGYQVRAFVLRGIS